MESFLRTIQKDYNNLVFLLAQRKQELFRLGKQGGIRMAFQQKNANQMDIDINPLIHCKMDSHNVLRCYTTRVILLYLLIKDAPYTFTARDLFPRLTISAIQKIEREGHRIAFLDKIKDRYTNTLLTIPRENDVRVIQVNLGGEHFPDHTFILIIYMDENQQLYGFILQSFYYMYTFQGTNGIIPIDTPRKGEMLAEMLTYYTYLASIGTIIDPALLESANRILTQFTGVDLNQHGVYQNHQFSGGASNPSMEIFVWDTTMEDIVRNYDARAQMLLNQSASQFGEVDFDYYIFKRGLLDMYAYTGLPTTVSFEDRTYMPFKCPQGCSLPFGKPYKCIEYDDFLETETPYITCGEGVCLTQQEEQKQQCQEFLFECTRVSGKLTSTL